MEPRFGSIPPGTWFALAEPAMFPWGWAHPMLVKLAEPAINEAGVEVNACGLCDGRLRKIRPETRVYVVVAQAPDIETPLDRG